MHTCSKRSTLPCCVKQRFWQQVAVAAPDQCWLWTGACSGDGYGAFKVGGRQYGAHRVAYWMAHGLWPEPFCLHSCHTPACVNLAHLRAGTVKDNSQDMVRAGRWKPRSPESYLKQRGEENGRARLTNAQAAEIRRRYAAERTRQVDLAAEYGVSQRTIGQLVRGVTWRVEAAGPIENAHIPFVRGTLTPEQVAEIRARYGAAGRIKDKDGRWASAGRPRQADLAAEYGVSQTAISNVVRGRRR